MKLILRRNDSATSLLLFIYNNYLEKTKRDSLKLLSLLEILKVFDKNESAIRMSLSRATKAGVLNNIKKDNEVSYSLTQIGKSSIDLWNTGVSLFWKRFGFRNSEWNGKWYLINVDSREDKKESKVAFIEALQQMGFALINTNTWISPYHQSEEVEKCANGLGLANEITELYGEMKIHKDTMDFLEEIFGLSRLKVPYSNFIEIYRKKLIETQEVYTQDWFINGGHALPLLHELGWNFFKVASDDALIPKQLFPNWEGDEAAKIMRELREILLQSAWQYLAKFN